MRLVTFLLTLLILGSAFAGYLYITQERVGTGTRFTLNWAQGVGSLATGPAQCYANRAPGRATYIVPPSDDSGPNTPDFVQDCTQCDCNNGLGGKKNYRCDTTTLQCDECPACPQGCGFGEKCDTSKGTCNSRCVCDPVACSGSYCVGDDVYTYRCSGNSCIGTRSKTCQKGCFNTGSGSVYYSGCTNGQCDAGTSYECPNCQNKITKQVTYKACGCQQSRNKCEVCPNTKTISYCPGQTPPDPNLCHTDGDCRVN